MGYFLGKDVKTVSKELGIPGLTVKSITKKDNLNDIIECSFNPLRKPHCESCEAKGLVAITNLNGKESYVRTVYDKVGKEIVILSLKHQRFICGNCNEEINYSPYFVASGVNTTYRLERSVAANCLENTYERANFSPEKSPSQIRDIFFRYSTRLQKQYEISATTYKIIGLHQITRPKSTYFVVSDLDNCVVIDVLTDYGALLDFLQRISNAGIRTCICDIDAKCLAATRGTLGQKNDIKMIASYNSMFRVISDACASYLEEHYFGKRRRIIISCLKTPIEKVISFEKRQIIKETLQNYNESNSEIIYKLVETYFNLRQLFNIQWSKTTFEEYLKSFSSIAEFQSCLSEIGNAESEISNCVYSEELQTKHKAVISKVESIVARSGKFNEEAVRHRILLTYRLQDTVDEAISSSHI